MIINPTLNFVVIVIGITLMELGFKGHDRYVAFEALFLMIWRLNPLDW